MKGRKPTPLALRLLRNNPNRRRLPTDEPAPPLTDATPPATLTGAALGIWQEFAPQLVAVGLLATIDRRHLARACRWDAIAEEQLAKAERTPLARTKANGAQPSVHFTAALKASEAADRIWFRFGITPVERARLGGSGKREPKDRLAEHLSRRPKAPRGGAA